MKFLSLGLMFLIATFAVTLAAAQEAVQTQDNSNTNIMQDIRGAVNESDAVIGDEDARAVAFKTATLGEGWIISSDNTKAEFLRGFWVSRNYLNVSNSEVQEIIQKNTDKEKAKEEISKLSSKMLTNGFGRIYIGSGKNFENLKLVKKELTNESASFYVIPINQKYKLDKIELANTSIGTLELEKKQYPSLTLWVGKLILTNGSHSGEWNAELASTTSTLKKTQSQGQATQGQQGQQIQEPKLKKPFWKKLMFWRKD